MIFVYILQGKMGKMEKITQLKWPKYQKPKDENMGWTKHEFLIILAGSGRLIIYFLIFVASVGLERDLTTEEMRKLLERNEVVQGGGQSGLQPFDLGNV